MKKLLTITTLLTLLISCSKDDNSGTLKVINQTDCINNIFDGLNDNGDLIGTVLENETKNFTIELGDLNSSGIFFFNEPQNCEGVFGEQFQVTINDGETTTIIID